MIRILAIVSLLGLAACADSGVVWSDTAVQPSAVERNRAMMVQNPADLYRARDASGRDGNRAVDVLAKYGRGEPTASSGEAAGNAAIIAIGQGKK